MPPRQTQQPLASHAMQAGPGRAPAANPEELLGSSLSSILPPPWRLGVTDMLVHKTGCSFLALPRFFCSLSALEASRTLQILPLPALSSPESGTAVTHCNPSPDRATALRAAPGRRESQSDWLGARLELPRRAAFLTWEAQGDLSSQLPPEQVRTRALHRPSLWPNYFHSCPHTLPVTAGIKMPITAHAFRRRCPVCQRFREGEVAEQERNGFASPACEVESNLAGTRSIRGRAGEGVALQTQTPS